MRDVRQLPASMTSVVEAPRAVSSDASPTRPLCAVKRASMPAARGWRIRASARFCAAYQDQVKTRLPAARVFTP